MPDALTSHDRLRPHRGQLTDGPVLGLGTAQRQWPRPRPAAAPAARARTRWSRRCAKRPASRFKRGNVTANLTAEARGPAAPVRRSRRARPGAGAGAGPRRAHPRARRRRAPRRCWPCPACCGPRLRQTEADGRTQDRRGAVPAGFARALDGAGRGAPGGGRGAAARPAGAAGRDRRLCMRRRRREAADQPEAQRARVMRATSRPCSARRPARAGGAARAGGGAARRSVPTCARSSTGSARMSRRRARCWRAGEGIGRKLDFLVQEFMREANTLCSKSASVALTRDRARPEGGDRAAARAGRRTSSDGLDGGRSARGVCLVLVGALGRRQVHRSPRRCWRAEPELALSVSATTRAPRPGEQDGVHYHFRDAAGVRGHGRGRRAAGMHAEVLRPPLRHAARAGRGGAGGGAGRAVRHRLAGASCSCARRCRTMWSACYLLPPSMAALEQPPAGRAARIPRRRSPVAWRCARSEIAHWTEFDHVLVNRISTPRWRRSARSFTRRGCGASGSPALPASSRSCFAAAADGA